MVLITGMLLAGIVGLVKYGLSVDNTLEQGALGAVATPTPPEQGGGTSGARTAEAVDTVAMVRSLRWVGETSRAIRAMASEPDGPWTPDRRSRLVDVSVLSQNVSGLQSCSKFYDKRVQRGHLVQLVSAVDGMPREPVTATLTGVIYESDTCREELGYQFKLSCDLAARVFSEEMVTCAGGTPRLLGGHENPLPVNALYLGAPPPVAASATPPGTPG